MTLIIINKTFLDLSYLSGLVTVSINSSTSVPSNYIFPVSRDPSLVYDVKNLNVTLGDGTNYYTGPEGLAFLNQIATSIGGAVVGLVGAPSPSYAITVGGKDGFGNVTVGSINSNGSLSVTGEGISGTPSGGVLSVQGTSSMTPFSVAGDVSSGSADSGKPVKIGSVYNSSLPSPSSGDRINSQANRFGELAIQYRNKFSNLTGNGTTTVKSGAGRLHGLTINKNWTGGTIVVYDNTAGSGTIIFTIDIGTPSGGLLSTTGTPGPIFLGPLGLEFSTGLTVVTSGSSNNNITILYQ